MRRKNSNLIDIVAIGKIRAEKALERFREIAVIGVSDPDLLLILNEVLKYWKDSSRPAIAAYCCEAVGGKAEVADNAGGIFILAAVATSIHDDIIDKSLKNHFRWTVLGKHGVEKALLVGDLFLVKAWSTVQELLRNHNKPIRVAEIVEGYGLISVQICEAEFLEMSCRKRLDTDLSVREKILWNLNADFEACAKTGAILGDGSSEEVLALSGVGRRLGFLLGLKDEVADCLNIQGNLPHRLLFESVPLPVVYAAKSSEDIQTKLQSIIQKRSIVSSDIATVVECCLDTGAFSYVNKLAKRSKNEALKMLKSIPYNTATTNLELIVENSSRIMDNLCSGNLD
jgi:geranylgeranyl pyrophosphate synthase